MYLKEGTTLSIPNSTGITIHNNAQHTKTNDTITSIDNRTIHLTSQILMVAGMFQVTEALTFYIHYLSQEDIDAIAVAKRTARSLTALGHQHFDYNNYHIPIL